MPPKKIQFAEERTEVEYSPESDKKTKEHHHIHFEVDEPGHDAEAAEERQHEIDHIVSAREKHQALDPGQTAKKDNFQQAFNIWEIPTVLNASNLTASDLRAELKARNLSTTGTRTHLVRRLEMYVREFESHRLEKAVDAEKKIILERRPKAGTAAAAAAAEADKKKKPAGKKAKAKAVPKGKAAKKK